MKFMKKILLLLFMLNMAWGVNAQYQIPTDIKQIMEKVSSGKQLSEQESARMKEWGESMLQQYEKQGNNIDEQGTPTSQLASTSVTSPNQNRNNVSPERIVLTINTQLTREQYIELAKSLMTTYGPKTGALPQLKQQLEKSVKQTDGADMGAAFMMTGAGSASVYAIAWSAVRSPDDILTANNLGVALKDMGEYTQAIEVLHYADRLKPNIGLILCNLGWAYWDVGDTANATIQFEKALGTAPSMSSPYLGLGLIAQCEKNYAKSEQYLRKSLRGKYSAIGFAAMAKAQEAISTSQQQSSTPRPLAEEKGDTGGLDIPDLPVSENWKMMIGQEETLNTYLSQLGRREQQLSSDLFSVSERMRMQQLKAIKDPDNSMVFTRNFSKEIMQFADITSLLFGENSNYARALNKGAKLLENNAEILSRSYPIFLQFQEKQQRLMKRNELLHNELSRCGDNKICQKKVKEKIDQLKYEMEQLEYQICKQLKSDLESTYYATARNYTFVSNAVMEAISDYYAFTNPIIERMYAPSINEYYNLYREMIVLNHLKISTGFAVALPPIADNLSTLKCVDPEPPPLVPSTYDPKLPKKEKKKCPLGENGIGGGIGPLSFELSCDHVKFSGGEGILWSVKRDFNKHETTIWGGVGVKGEYGSGNLTGEATVGVEITIGQDDAVKDVAFTSSVKAGVGGLVEGEVSGRFALEGGPSVSADANITPPSISDLMGY